MPRQYVMHMALSIPRYTIEDLDRFPDDGNRYEILDGFLMVTPSPGMPQQSVAARLQYPPHARRR